MIKIQSLFHKAGKIYGWEGPGVGIQVKELQGDNILQLEIIGKMYKIDKPLARQIIKRYNSLQKFNFRTPTLAILPLSEFLPM